MTLAPHGHPNPCELAAFDAGLLRPDQREEIERHVANCSTCCRILEGLPEDALAMQIRGYVAPSTEQVTDTCISSQVSLVAAVWTPPVEFVGHSRYEILASLGEGGMGTVYRAQQRHMDRIVAIKVLHRRLTDRPGFLQRFKREVKILAQLNHLNIVAAYDADVAGESHFLVMEHIEGENLDVLVRRRGPLPVDQAMDLVRQAAHGLQHAHERGMVHRDVKPQNLLLTTYGVLKVVDFGLARLVQPDERPASDSFANVVGTPDFMSPEQARNPQEADIRSDLYSLGCTLYFLLTGGPPYSRATSLQILLAHQDEPLPSIRHQRPDVPEAVERILRRLLSKEPDQRFNSPDELADVLIGGSRAIVEPSKAHRFPYWMIGAFVAIAGAIIVAIFQLNADRTGLPISDATVAFIPPATPEPEQLMMPREVRKAPMGKLATVEERDAMKRENADQLLAWVRINNRAGPQAMMVDTMAGQIKQRPDYDGYRFLVGGELLNSGKSTLLIATIGGFHVFELTDRQAERMNLGPRQHIFVTIRRTKQGWRFPGRIALSDLKIDNADHFDRQGFINGTVHYSFPEFQERPACLRVTAFPPDGGRISFMRPTKTLIPAGEGVLSFALSPLNAKALQHERWLILYAEWVTIEDGQEVVESNTVAGLIWFEN